MSKYKCPACNKVMERESISKKYRSFCVAKGKNVWMKKVKQ